MTRFGLYWKVLMKKYGKHFKYEKGIIGCIVFLRVLSGKTYWLFDELILTRLKTQTKTQLIWVEIFKAFVSND